MPEGREKNAAKSLFSESSWHHLFLALSPPLLTICLLAIPVSTQLAFSFVKVGGIALFHGLFFATAVFKGDSNRVQAALFLFLYCSLTVGFSFLGYESEVLHRDYHPLSIYVALLITTVLLTILSALFASLASSRLPPGSSRRRLLSGLQAFVLQCQLLFSLVFGAVFHGQSNAVRYVMCSCYPLAINVFKVLCGKLSSTAEVVDEDDDFKSDGSHFMSIVSLAMAAVPYRIIFLDLDSLEPFFIILAIESVYKVIVYPLNLSLLFIELQEKLRRRKTAAVSSLFPSFGGDEYVSRPSHPSDPSDSLSIVASSVSSSAQSSSSDPTSVRSSSLSLQSSLASSLSDKFTVHQFLDSSAAAGVLYVFLFLRYCHGMSFVPGSAGSDVDDDKGKARFDLLMLEYGVGLLLECVLHPLYLLGIRRGLGLWQFKVHFWRFLKRDHWAIFVAQGLTYFTIFAGAVDIERPPQ